MCLRWGLAGVRVGQVFITARGSRGTVLRDGASHVRDMQGVCLQTELARRLKTSHTIVCGRALAVL